jgi:hypothetical protein
MYVNAIHERQLAGINASVYTKPDAVTRQEGPKDGSVNGLAVWLNGRGKIDPHLISRGVTAALQAGNRGTKDYVCAQRTGCTCVAAYLRDCRCQDRGGRKSRAYVRETRKGRDDEQFAHIFFSWQPQRAAAFSKLYCIESRLT